MSKFKRLKAEINQLTPEFLAWFRELPPSPMERDLKPSRVNYLRDQADAGELVPFYWVTARLRNKPNSLIRINGQHSSNMLAQLPSLDPDLIVFYTEWEVENKSDLALLYRKYDARQSGRSPIDICNAYHGLEPELATISTPIVKLGTEGAFWYYQNVVGEIKGVKGDDRYNRLIEEPEDHPFLQWIGTLIGNSKELRQTPVIAAMYGAFARDQESAREFFADVEKGTGPENDPAQVLDEWLTIALDKGHGITIQPKHYWNASAFAWNAYREGRTIASIPATARGYGIQKGLHELL
jgi:hypothetical protein